MADTHCPYCALQCGMTVVGAGEKIVAARDFPTNKGGLCRKGWTSTSLLQAPGRLTKPLIRDKKHGPLRETSWDDALARVATRMRSLRDSFGADALGIFGGGGLTNEKVYLLGKFARVVLGTRYIDYNGRFCMASAAAANLRAFGLDRGLPFPLDDIAEADTILIAGGNPADTMPPIMRYFEALRQKGGRLIVSDPRRTATAKAADLHLQLAPGTDAALANGLLHVAIRDRLIDQSFIDARTTGFEAVRQIVKTYWPDRVERITGVPAALITRSAHLLAKAPRAMVLSARGAEQQVQGVNNVLALINLVLALGKAGRPGSGYGCLTGQGNGQGGREHGQKADQLPGYRRLDDPEHRAWMAKIWGIKAQDLPGPGCAATELFAKLGSDIQALMVVGANPAVSAPNVAKVQQNLKALDFLVVFDFFLSETAELADVVLPVAQWAEEDGTMTNLEGRILLRRKAAPPPSGVRTDIEILAELAARLGHGQGFGAEGPEAVFDELCRASAGGQADYAGVSWQRIVTQEGVFWPCPKDDHPGTPRLFLDRFATPDGRARFHPVHHRPPAEETNARFPLIVTTGRLLLHYQSGTQTRRVVELARLEPGPVVMMHPQLARSFCIEEGDSVRVLTRRGSIIASARLTSDLRLDTLFLPFHWGGASAANILTVDSVDPISKIPEFKICAGRIERLLLDQAGDPASQSGLDRKEDINLRPHEHPTPRTGAES